MLHAPSSLKLKCPRWRRHMVSFVILLTSLDTVWAFCQSQQFTYYKLLILLGIAISLWFLLVINTVPVKFSSFSHFHCLCYAQQMIIMLWTSNTSCNLLFIWQSHYQLESPHLFQQFSMFYCHQVRYFKFWNDVSLWQMFPNQLLSESLLCNWYITSPVSSLSEPLPVSLCCWAILVLSLNWCSSKGLSLFVGFPLSFFEPSLYIGIEHAPICDSSNILVLLSTCTQSSSLCHWTQWHLCALSDCVLSA